MSNVIQLLIDFKAFSLHGTKMLKVYEIEVAEWKADLSHKTDELDLEICRRIETSKFQLKNGGFLCHKENDPISIKTSWFFIGNVIWAKSNFAST